MFLCKMEAEALSMPGLIYRHYKGGIYRLVLSKVKNTDTGQLGIVWEHLWPHKHGYVWRPESELDDEPVPGVKRFVLVSELKQ